MLLQRWRHSNKAAETKLRVMEGQERKTWEPGTNSSIGRRTLVVSQLFKPCTSAEIRLQLGDLRMREGLQLAARSRGL